MPTGRVTPIDQDAHPTGDQLAAKGVDPAKTIGEAMVEVLTGLPVVDPPSILIPSLDEIRQAVKARAAAADTELARLRAERDEIAGLIRSALVESVEAHRILHSLEPRTKKDKP